ncbi:MAG TPA: argininosuccinate lyase [Caulobacteraceae bacterium]|nr:argininosuccinate lyase [Caulobacteraceae bacterium]
MSSEPTDSQGHLLWGGRFSAKPGALMQAINVSIGFDRRLAAEDIAGSKAHADMLAATGVIAAEDNESIQSGLRAIERELVEGVFPYREEFEDIHFNIEQRLIELVGAPGGRLHTARSRNDQVALDMRLWVRGACDRTGVQIKALQRALLAQAEAHAATLMPGFTHLQTAQPVTFGHHLMAYVEMFGRDAGRFEAARERMNESPLGAAALAGTSFPIDRGRTAAALGFDRPMANSLDAVSARDFVLEALAAAGILSLNLSRLAEELVLWMTPQFGFVALSDAFTTGSSIMPQKRNPDAAELVRAKSGRILGAFAALSLVMKGLPLAYSKDMQEDKVPTFEAFDALELALAAMAGMVADMRADAARMARASAAGYATATDLADWLVRVLKTPFRDAHRVAGQAVKRAEALGLDLERLPLFELQSFEPRITPDVFEVLSPEASVASRTSLGGTAPIQVRAQIVRWKELLR